MSNLNSHLYNRHLTNNSSCACGSPNETAEHYLLLCPIYDNLRHNAIHNIPRQHRDEDLLLFGNSRLANQENMDIFSLVHKYIHLSGRF